MRALIAMSGGVDSSMAAKLLLDQGYDCVGCTMKLYRNEDIGLDRSHTCCALEDVEDARSVAYRLGMRHYVFNFTEDFHDKVIEKFISCYENGQTPNPCIDCNRYMKFAKLYDRAQILACDFIATGHYARIEKHNGNFLLKKALDETKDQSYVLYFMSQQQLACTLLPLGGMTKKQVRALAETHNFCNAAKPDSQDICFAPNGDYASIIELHRGQKAPVGNFVDASGNILGRHRGIIHYTIGQRRGLGILGKQPWYVCSIRPQANEIMLGCSEELFRRNATAVDFNWISGCTPAAGFRCKVKIRYRQMEQWARVTPTGEDTVHIEFEEAQRAITPGQAAVLYDGDVVLGGGTLK